MSPTFLYKSEGVTCLRGGGGGWSKWEATITSVGGGGVTRCNIWTVTARTRKMIRNSTKIYLNIILILIGWKVLLRRRAPSMARTIGWCDRGFGFTTGSLRGWYGVRRAVNTSQHILLRFTHPTPPSGSPTVTWFGQAVWKVHSICEDPTRWLPVSSGLLLNNFLYWYKKVVWTRRLVAVQISAESVSRHSVF